MGYVRQIRGDLGYRVEVSSHNALYTTPELAERIAAGYIYFIDGTSSLMDTNVLEVLLVTPAAPALIHMEYAFNASQKTEFAFYESSTKTHVPGNAITPLNRNRNSAYTTNTTWCHTPGGSGDGNLFSHNVVGANTNKVKYGGEAGAEQIILKAATSYLMRVTSHADDNDINYLFFWDENGDA
jgi:hypothetical protein